MTSPPPAPPSAQLYCGDSLSILTTLPSGSARCCVTSPPYWGLRDYGVAGQFGLERTPEDYVTKIVAVFREVRRCLTDDGTLWLNIGDSYAANRGYQVPDNKHVDVGNARGMKATDIGLKPKDLVGIPWLVAFALRADGWYLRCDIIWAKPNPMPESVTDRPTKSHEYLFLLSKSAKYYYDAAAIREEPARIGWRDETRTEPGNPDRNDGGGITARPRKSDKQRGHSRRHDGFNDRWDAMSKDEQQAHGANARSVWSIGTQPYPEAHFATFPEELARRCILAGSAPGDTVLDPFGGSGTVAQVAIGNGRGSIYIDLNPKYVQLAQQRIGPMFCVDGAA